MTQTTCSRAAEPTAGPSAPTGYRPGTGTGYRHEAFLWHGLEEFLARTAPFVAEAVDQQMPIMVAVPEAHGVPLRDALGDRARSVTFVDMTELGHNPARIIPAWADFIAANGAGTRPLRGIGEPIWAGRRDAEVVECQIHEAMLNLAVPTDTPFWLLCPYEADALGDEVLEAARRSHPTVIHGAHHGASHTYADEHDPLNLSRRELTARPADAHEVRFRSGDLSHVRRTVARFASEAGLPERRISDLVLGVNEVAANSLDHGGGSGVLRAWQERDALVFEVTDSGRLENLLVGRVTPRPAQPRGRGLWMVNRLCDLVQIRTAPSGTVIRVVTWL